MAMEDNQNLQEEIERLEIELKFQHPASEDDKTFEMKKTYSEKIWKLEKEVREKSLETELIRKQLMNQLARGDGNVHQSTSSQQPLITVNEIDNSSKQEDLRFSLSQSQIRSTSQLFNAPRGLQASIRLD